jgi:hypothetical protein
MSERPTNERVVVIHRARTLAEAVILRGLLESAGIASPAPMSADQFPMRLSPKGLSGSDIQVLASQADDARAILADYYASAGQPADEEPGDEL